jgi:LAO/AO transport system kinase
MVRVLDAYGCDVVIVETVGVGQDELEITRTAHSTLVVMAPGMGDEVQAIKAGILETADVFAVNKADRDGADSTMRDLELMIALGTETMVASGKNRAHVVHGGAKVDAIPTGPGTTEEHWTPPIAKCVATKGEGIAELVEALDRHKAWLDGTHAGRARRHLRLAEELRESLRETLIEAATHALGSEIERAVDDVEKKTIDPYTATEQLLTAFRAR